MATLFFFFYLRREFKLYTISYVFTCEFMVSIYMQPHNYSKTYLLAQLSAWFRATPFAACHKINHHYPHCLRNGRQSPQSQGQRIRHKSLLLHSFPKRMSIVKIISSPNQTLILSTNCSNQQYKYWYLTCPFSRQLSSNNLDEQKKSSHGLIYGPISN